MLKEVNVPNRGESYYVYLSIDCWMINELM